MRSLLVRPSLAALVSLAAVAGRADDLILTIKDHRFMVLAE